MADELYGLAPAEFTAARDQRARRARAEGQKDLGDEIKKLRRPTVSASLVNRLVREDADQVDRLLDLGESMRDAQQGLAGGQLRRLSAQRRPAIHALAQEAKRLAAQAGSLSATRSNVRSRPRWKRRLPIRAPPMLSGPGG